MFYKAIPVAIYALFCSLVAAVLVRFFEVTGTVVGIYAIIVALGALSLPLWKPLDKEIVDFCYYGIAILVTWQLFVFQGPRREATLRLVEHWNTETQIDRVKSTQTRHDAILKDPDSFVKAIRLGAQDRYRRLRIEQSDTCQQVQALETQASLAESAQKYLEAANLRMQEHNVQANCTRLTSLVSQEDWPVFKEIKATSTLMAHRNFLRMVRIDIYLQGGRLSLAETTEELFGKTVVSGVEETAVLESQRIALETEAVRLQDRVQQLKSKESEGDFEIRKKAAVAAGEFVEVLWPFMLICLLGMKLARTNHVGLIMASLMDDA